MIGVIGALDEHHAALLKLAGLTATIIAMAAYIDRKEFSDFISVANDCVFQGQKHLRRRRYRHKMPWYEISPCTSLL